MKRLRLKSDGSLHPFREHLADHELFEVFDTKTMKVVSKPKPKRKYAKKSRKNTEKAPATTDTEELNSDLGSLDELSNQ